MSEINYQAEVKKVYPDAICKRVHNIDSRFIYATFSKWPMSGIGLISDDFENHFTSKDAWQSAYTTLIKSGKIQ